MTSHQFFTKLAEAWIAEISRMTPDGSLFRIDLRLRPEGKSGPLVRSFDSYESFYAQWGQTWERMMLIKARPVGGDTALGAEFLEMVQTFRYPRSLSQRTLREVAGFVSERLSPLEGVLSTSTHFMLKTYKRFGVLMQQESSDERLSVSP